MQGMLTVNTQCSVFKFQVLYNVRGKAQCLISHTVRDFAAVTVDKQINNHTMYITDPEFETWPLHREWHLLSLHQRSSHYFNLEYLIIKWALSVCWIASMAVCYKCKCWSVLRRKIVLPTPPAVRAPEPDNKASVAMRDGAGASTARRPVDTPPNWDRLYSNISSLT